MLARKSTAFSIGLLTGYTLMLSAQPALSQQGSVYQTPVTPMELPVELEIELSPAGSLKQAALWKELVEYLEEPYEEHERRPGFGVTMPDLDTYPLDYNFLTGQPMRLRTSDGEISWDNPGPMFLPDDDVEVDEFNTPTELRTIIGHLVACPNEPEYEGAELPEDFCEYKPEGSLVVYNPNDASPEIPPNGTVVAVAAFFDGMLHELEIGPDGWTGEYEELDELEQPVNEEHFIRDREAAEVLGKAFFWDMQVGSDGVQACGSCHFHAGVDNRTRNQLNPNTTNSPRDLDYEVQSVAGSPTSNVEVVASDFPFHKRANPAVVGDGTDPALLARPDANDVMASMGVSRFKQFTDIKPIGPASFGPAVLGVRPLLPDNGNALNEATHPAGVPIMAGVRRIEPRNTPTFHGTAFNFDNFWDGRARFHFNGGSVFGPSDPQFHIWVNNGTPNGGVHGLPDPSEDTIDLELYEWGPLPGVPARIKFSSLASQAVGPPLSEFEMSFLGRNWPKIGKKLLQANVTPLANQLVDINDSVLGPYSWQGGSSCPPAQVQMGKPGICITYNQLIQQAFEPALWANTNQRFNGAANPSDPFDGYVLTLVNGPANPANTNQFRQREANFSLFFALAVQAYESLTIPDDTAVDRFFDANPNAGHGVGEPGDQAVLFPTLITDLIDDGLLNDSGGAFVTLVEGFGADELFGFDLFAGANLTAALAPSQEIGSSGRNRNPLHTVTNADGDPVQIRVGSNPFTRSAKCMLCHLGAEQTDHSINISHGLLKNDAEFEYPTPPTADDPLNLLGDNSLPAPEPSGSARTVIGLVLSEEVTEGPAQDAVEVEPRNFATFDLASTSWDDAVVGQPGFFAFGDQGVYNLGLRPSVEDLGRGGDDPWGWPLSLAALTLKNIGGQDFEPCDGPADSCVMADFDPFELEEHFEEAGDGALFAGTEYELESINPGFERDPIDARMPEHMVPWMHGLPAGELHPQIDEMAGMVPNTITAPNGGPGIEFAEILFGADLHCALYDPEQFGTGPPTFGWGAPDQDGVGLPSMCPQNQSGVTGNEQYPAQGTWPVPNRVLRDGAFKAPPLRNVELTGPYFHTGSFLTLRQVVDFYFRGGDFPITNAENRDPNVMDLFKQAFAFGRTTGDDLREAVDHVFSVDPPFTLVGTFADGLPDTAFLYDNYPDSDHPLTPEPVFASRGEALDDAKNSIVKFLIALTDARVKHDRAPFDHPEIFVPIDGAAPENTGGRPQLNAQTGVPCPVPGPGSAGICFQRVPAVGAAGSPLPHANFLGISSTPVPGPNNDHFDP